MYDKIRPLRYGGMQVHVAPNEIVGSMAAQFIEDTIHRAVAARGRAVLGLATGATPEAVYARLVDRHEAGALSFSDVTTYNLDEYYPISPVDPRSYRTYMHRHLFGRVDIAPHRAHMLDGTVPESFAGAYAAEFDRWIEADGGLDLQLLGIGRNGHIGFNEPSDIDVAERSGCPPGWWSCTRSPAPTRRGSSARRMWSSRVP